MTSMSESEDRQALVDGEHLRVLSIAYIISACLDWLFSLLGLLYALFGLFILKASSADPGSEGPPPVFVAWLFGLIGSGLFVTMIVFGILKFLVHRRLRERRSRVFCLVVAAFSCIWMPYGTILGVFTFVVLCRYSVVRAFETPDPIAGAAEQGMGGSP
jgi:hypothetical protein